MERVLVFVPCLLEDRTHWLICKTTPCADAMASQDETYLPSAVED